MWVRVLLLLWISYIYFEWAFPPTPPILLSVPHRTKNYITRASRRKTTNNSSYNQSLSHHPYHPPSPPPFNKKKRKTTKLKQNKTRAHTHHYHSITTTPSPPISLPLPSHYHSYSHYQATRPVSINFDFWNTRMRTLRGHTHTAVYTQSGSPITLQHLLSATVLYRSVHCC